MKYTYYLFFLLIFTSCTKETTIHISAKNSATGTPYANLKYFVVEYKSAAFEGKYTTILEGNLNSNGEVFLTEKLKKNRAYIIRVDQPENVCYQTPEGFSYTYAISDGENPNFEFQFAECAYLKLNINNVNCSGQLDAFKLYHLGSDVGYLNLDAPIKIGEGCYSYIGSFYSDVPMGQRFYKWEVTRNGLTETFYDTIYLNAGEYKTYEINY